MADDGPVIEEVLDDVDSDDDDMPALNGAEGGKDAATEDVLDDDEVRARADATGEEDGDRDRNGCVSARRTTPNALAASNGPPIAAPPCALIACCAAPPLHGEPSTDQRNVPPPRPT